MQLEEHLQDAQYLRTTIHRIGSNQRVIQPLVIAFFEIMLHEFRSRPMEGQRT